MSLDWIYNQRPSLYVEVRNKGYYYGKATNIDEHLIRKTDDGFLVNINNIDWEGFIEIDFGYSTTHCLHSRLYRIDAKFPTTCRFKNPKNEYHILLIFYNDGNPSWKIMLRDKVWNHESDEHQKVTKGHVMKSEMGLIISSFEGDGSKTKNVR